MGFKFLQAGSHHFGQMTLLVAFCHADSFIELAFTQRASDDWSELAGLFASGTECDPAVNHYTNGPGRHNKENDNDNLGDPAHLFPQVDGVPTDSTGVIASCCLEPES